MEKDHLLAQENTEQKDLEGASTPEVNPDDINEWAIEIQRGDGIDVGPEWWGRNIDSKMPIAEQRKQFLAAYERDFPRGEDGQRYGRERV